MNHTRKDWLLEVLVFFVYLFGFGCGSLFGALFL